ncbi:MAG TPA: septum formation initiator family protein [Chthoniobacteraceae bacterium]|nr:septum formation initiator family protein [Chthoniobacteraceae bacterium]
MSAAHREFQNPSPAGGIWHCLNRFLFTLIVLTLLATAAYRMLPEIGKRKEQQARVEELRAQVEKDKQTLASNLRVENLLKRDPEYVGLIARDRLDLAAPNETIYRLDGPKNAR